MTNAAIANYALEQIDLARANSSAGGRVVMSVAHVSVHRHRGVDAAVGGRPGRDAGGAGGSQPRSCARPSQAHDGEVFNYTGDGMCAVFASPRSAVDAAVAAQRALELPVRMGIATGEAELRGDDYFGTVLNRTARVMAAGHGGQILLDGATAGLISGVDLMSLGPRRLRDIAKPVDVFQVRAAGPAHRVPTAEDGRSDTGKSSRHRPRVSLAARRNWPSWRRR